MDVEKLIERLKQNTSCWTDTVYGYADLRLEAATALSTLQAENAQLRESRNHWKRLAHELSEGVNGKDAEHERLQAENEKLRNEVERQRRSADDRKHLYENAERAYMKVLAELERVTAERDAAVNWAQKYTESIDRPCVACKHNTGDYVCTAICGNCGPMGTESCKWEFDFSGELKED